MSSCEATITIIFNCYNHSFWTNEVPLFKVVFNVALFHVALFQYCIIFTISCSLFLIFHWLMFHYLMLHYFPFALVVVSLFNFVVLLFYYKMLHYFIVALYQCCPSSYCTIDVALFAFCTIYCCNI